MSSLVSGQLGQPLCPWPHQSQQGFPRGTKLARGLHHCWGSHIRAHARTHTYAFLQELGLVHIPEHRGGKTLKATELGKAVAQGQVFRKMPRRLLTDVLSETQLLHGGNFKKPKAIISIVLVF